jgi:hypothetical protein
MKLRLLGRAWRELSIDGGSGRTGQDVNGLASILPAPRIAGTPQNEVKVCI